MEKKNKNIMTISFDKDDPQHQEVIEILNALGRKKAKFIVKTVLYYETESCNPNEKVDYQSIKNYVFQLMAQYEAKQDSTVTNKNMLPERINLHADIEEKSKVKIKNSINAFRHK